MNFKPKTTDYWTLQKCCDYIYELTNIKRLPNTLLVWHRKGLIGQHGKRIKLKTVVRIKRRYCTQIWLDHFLKEIG
jgi:hypothetical protein